MKQNCITSVLTIILAFVSAVFVSAQSIKAYEIVQRMFEQSRQVTSMRYILTKKERVNGQLNWSRNQGKLTTEPYRVYMKKLEPNGGLEVLFVEGANKNRLLINPNGFPWVNVSLDPYNARALKDQHHTIYEAGFNYFASIADYVLKSYGKNAHKTVNLVGMSNVNGTLCYHIVQENPGFKFVDYTVQKGETLLSIAQDKRLNAHMIIENNPSIVSFDQVREGMSLKIPTYYCKKMELFISKQLMLPILIRVFDNEGLFEEYSYEKLEINPVIPDKEFQKDYKDYNF